jgi:hypothetical protein
MTHMQELAESISLSLHGADFESEEDEICETHTSEITETTAKITAVQCSGKFIEITITK